MKKYILMLSIACTITRLSGMINQPPHQSNSVCIQKKNNDCIAALICGNNGEKLFINTNTAHLHKKEISPHQPHHALQTPTSILSGPLMEEVIKPVQCFISLLDAPLKTCLLMCIKHDNGSKIVYQVTPQASINNLLSNYCCQEYATLNNLEKLFEHNAPAWIAAFNKKNQ